MPNADKKAAKDTAKAEAPKRERKVLTDAERIAKLEADLRAAKEKAEAKTQKKVDALLARRKQLREQVAARQAKVDEVDEQLRALGHTLEIEDIQVAAASNDAETNAA